ncbi:MAG: tetratricopeptide repeat protein [Armatimonadota bacterium]
MEEAAEFYYWRAHDLSDRTNCIQALSYAQAALEIEPGNVEALVLIGDIHTLFPDALGLDTAISYKSALEYLDRALDIEPKHADALGAKALTLIYTQRFEEALDTAERGLFVLPLRIGYGMNHDSVYTNIAEALFDRKVRALLGLGRDNEARQTLSDGLLHCPGSKYLTRLIDDVIPDLITNNPQ